MAFKDYLRVLIFVPLLAAFLAFRRNFANDDLGRYFNTAVLSLSALHLMHKGSIP
jgi:hypothetical protein